MSINIYKEIIWSLFQFKIVRIVSKHAFLNFKENNVHQVYKVDVTNKPETYITWLHTGTLYKTEKENEILELSSEGWRLWHEET